jgi:hypothetical protein
MKLGTPNSAIISAIIFNAIIIPMLVPLALRGVRYRPGRRHGAAATQPAHLRPRRPDRTVHRDQAHRPHRPQPAGGLRMAYAPTTAPPPMRLGLRARLNAVREARMVSERSRRRLAEAIEQSVARAERPRRGFSAAVPIVREAARDARGALLDLAERLRAPRPVAADGMREARMLLVDGSGPPVR